MSYDVGFIGTGPEPENPVWGESAAMAYRHGAGYRQDDRCEPVACADLVQENAEDFAEEFDIDADRVFEDYNEMLATVQPDIVSVATPVPTHAPIVLDVIDHEDCPEAIHCEKPMADTWADCRAMAEAADENGVQLTFNHQRRFGENWREAKRILDDGEIGELRRVEMGGKNLLDYGTHLMDLCHFYNDERGAEWVLNQVDYREEDVRYGTHNENQALALWGYENGVHGIASTGDEGWPAVGCHNRIVGTEGEIEVATDDGTDLRVTRAGEGTEEYDLDDDDLIPKAISHVVDCLESGEQPELSAEHGLRVCEVIFGAWESARRRGRVDFPLDAEGNSLTELVESGALNPRSE